MSEGVCVSLLECGVPFGFAPSVPEMRCGCRLELVRRVWGSERRGCTGKLVAGCLCLCSFHGAPLEFAPEINTRTAEGLTVRAWVDQARPPSQLRESGQPSSLGFAAAARSPIPACNPLLTLTDSVHLSVHPRLALLIRSSYLRAWKHHSTISCWKQRLGFGRTLLDKSPLSRRRDRTARTVQRTAVASVSSLQVVPCSASPRPARCSSLPASTSMVSAKENPARARGVRRRSDRARTNADPLLLLTSCIPISATSSNNATGGPSSRPNIDEPTPANTRVKRRPRRGTAPSSSYSKASSPSPPLASPLVDAEPSLPPPPPYASIATGSTSEERKQAQDAKVAIIEEILKEDDLYKLLGCKKSSKPEEIRRGFLNRSRSCHPE